MGDSKRWRLIIEKGACWCITPSDQSLIDILLENLMRTYFSHGRNGCKNKTSCSMARKRKASYTILLHCLINALRTIAHLWLLLKRLIQRPGCRALAQTVPQQRFGKHPEMHQGNCKESVRTSKKIKGYRPVESVLQCQVDKTIFFGGDLRPFFSSNQKQ